MNAKLEKLYEKARALNEDLAARRPDLKWIVQNERLELIDCPEWSERHAKAVRKRMEEDRQKFLDRQVLPLDRYDLGGFD